MNEEFVLRPLAQVEQCNPFDLIFSLETLKKFQKRNTNDVLFVTENHKIKGVVHIVDYNREFVFMELYRLIFNFETMLREFLFSTGVNNSTIIEFYRQKSEGEPENSFWKSKHADYTRNKGRKKLQEAMGPLQIFYLSDLLNYYLYKGMISEVNKQSIIRIRNKIAHSKDIISRRRNEEAEKLYNFKGLEQFVNDALIFFTCYEFLEESTQNLKSTDSIRLHRKQL